MQAIKYRCFEREIPEDLFQGIWKLHRLIFGSRISGRDFRRRLERKKSLVCAVATNGGKVIGYKLGYERNSEEFYSWLGGVKNDHRRRGIATKLMRLQHQRALRLGYKRVITESGNEWRNMIILNLTNGFEIIGTCMAPKGVLKIILAKSLSKRSQ